MLRRILGGGHEDDLRLLDQHEQATGLMCAEPVEWQRPNTRRPCRIRKVITLGGYRDEEEKWPQIHEAMVNDMIHLEEALRPYIKKLSI